MMVCVATAERQMNCNGFRCGCSKQHSRPLLQFVSMQPCLVHLLPSLSRDTSHAHLRPRRYPKAAQRHATNPAQTNERRAPATCTKWIRRRAALESECPKLLGGDVSGLQEGYPRDRRCAAFAMCLSDVLGQSRGRTVGWIPGQVKSAQESQGTFASPRTSPKQGLLSAQDAPRRRSVSVHSRDATSRAFALTISSSRACTILQ